MLATNKLKITKPSVIKLLYQMTFDATRILDANNIKYWAIGGTMLGSKRHQGIIPWDDDVDLGVTDSDMKKLLRMQIQFNNCGYTFIKTWFGYKMIVIGRKNIKGENYSFPNIDFFTFKINGSKYIQSRKMARDTWPKEWYTKNQILKITKAKFGDFYINIPGDSTKYLNRLYGRDWNIIAYRQYDHEKEEMIEQIKVKLTDKDRVPAQPTKVVKKRCIKSL